MYYVFQASIAGVIALAVLGMTVAFAGPSEDLIRAAQDGDAAKVKTLIAKGVNVNTKDSGYERTALMYAAWRDRLEVVKLLLANGADAKAEDKDGWTSMIYAAYKGHLKVVEAHLAEGIDVNVTNSQGETMLMHAANEGRLNVARLLLAKGANINAKGNDGRTALMHASQRCLGIRIRGTLSNSKMIEMLLASGAVINSKDNNGQTALMYAATQGYIDVLKSLLANGADLNAKDNNGLTALAHASKCRPDVRALLGDKKAKDSLNTDNCYFRFGAKTRF
jgi:ankyrin repeat protein